MQLALRIGVTLFGLAGAILLLSYGITELIDDPELKEGLDIEKDVVDGAWMLALAALALVGSVAVWFQRPRQEESIWDRLNPEESNMLKHMRCARVCPPGVCPSKRSPIV